MAEFHCQRQTRHAVLPEPHHQPVEQVKYEKLKSSLHSPLQGYPNPLKEIKL